MDKKTFLTLLYITSFLPMTYMIGQLYLPNRGWIGIGLLNMIVLLLMYMLFAASKDATSMKKKKIGLMMVALLIGATLFSGVIDGLLIKGSARLHTMLNSSSVVAPSMPVDDHNKAVSGSVLTIPEPTVTTGNTGATGKIILESDDEVLSKEPVNEQTALTTSTVSTKESTTVVNGSYGAIIPYLVRTYNLKDTDKLYPKFTRISQKNSLYASFATAYAKGMIGTSINPASKVSCDTYLVLKGIAAGWKVSYTGKPFAAYRAEAQKRDAVNGCVAGTFVTSKTL